MFLNKWNALSPGPGSVMPSPVADPDADALRARPGPVPPLCLS